jgi:hypothetical protein
MKKAKKTSNAQRPTPNVQRRSAIEIIELLDQWDDGDLIHLLARGTYPEDFFRARCGQFLKDDFYNSETRISHRISRVRHCLCRMIPRGERGDEYKIENVRGRGTFPATVADIEYVGGAPR